MAELFFLNRRNRRHRREFRSDAPVYPALKKLTYLPINTNLISFIDIVIHYVETSKTMTNKEIFHHRTEQPRFVDDVAADVSEMQNMHTSHYHHFRVKLRTWGI